MVIYGAVSLNIRFNSYNKDNMKDLEKHTYELDGDKDIVIDGLCFIKFTKNIKVDIYTLESVEPVVRDNLIWLTISKKTCFLLVFFISLKLW